MVEQFAAPPINPLVSIRPLTTPAPGRDATNVQSELAALPPGTTLEGFVVKRDVNNNPILRTSLGDLQMQSEVFVKTGSQMVIRVDATTESRARIITIDGLAPQDYAAQSGRGITQDTISQSGLLPGSKLPLQQGTLLQQQVQTPLQGMLLSAPAAGAAAPHHPLFAAMPGANATVPAMLLQLQAGTPLRVRIMDFQLSSPVQNAVAASPMPGATAANAAPLPQASAVPLPAATAQDAPGQVAMASPQVARAAMQVPGEPMASAAPVAASKPFQFMPGQPASAPFVPNTTMPAAAPAPEGIAGLVVGHAADGGNIVHTNFGSLKVFSPSPLPIHSRLQLQVEPQADPQAPRPLPTAMPVSEDTTQLSNLSRGWPQLEEALHWAGAHDAPIARDLGAALPQVNHKLASGLVFFLAAVKGGELKQWLGNRAVSALEALKPDVAAKLKGDMAQLQQLFLHSPLDQWTSVMLPMLHEGQLEYAKLYLRDEPREKNNPSQGKEQRFIVEVELSAIGDIQFDGFVRQGQAKKQFDLMVRSARPLDTAMANDIRELFDTSVQATGYQGYVGFQAGSQHFVRPLATSAATPPDDSHTLLA